MSANKAESPVSPDIWRLVADASADAVIAVRDEGTIILWNQSATDLFGWESKEVDGKKFVDLVIPPVHRRAILDYMEKYLETGDKAIFKKSIEIFGLAKDGREFPIALTIVPKQIESEKLFVAFIRDSSKQKALNDRLRQSHKMEALGALAGGIAHEFNNILAAISGNLILVRDDILADHPITESLTEIEKATARATYVVRQILTFSSAKGTVMEPVNLGLTLVEAVKLLRATVPATMEIGLNCEPDLPPILSDITEVHQILLNFGINAQQAMDQKTGKFNVLVTSQILDDDAAEALGLKPGTYVVMSARDNGCGMDAQTLDKIFDPFFTTKPVGEGTGLGLSIVYGIVTRSGGAITVTSEPVKGTEFQIYFPAIHALVVQRPEQIRHPLPGNGERILYVDDDEALVHMLTRILKRQNYKVIGFLNPIKALAAFREAPDSFDIVITDLSMPEMDGVTLVHRLQEIRPNVPIVMVTGFIRPKDLEQASQLGISELILKPNTATEMGEVLHRIFSEARDKDASLR